MRRNNVDITLYIYWQISWRGNTRSSVFFGSKRAISDTRLRKREPNELASGGRETEYVHTNTGYTCLLYTHIKIANPYHKYYVLRS